MTTALIAIGSTVRDDKIAAAYGRAHAGFVAHLIATAAQAPQTRVRRRAEPDEATAAYRALGQWPSTAGAVLSQSL